MKILVADDDPQLVRALRITLAAHGYEVVAAPDGAAAHRARGTGASRHRAARPRDAAPRRSPGHRGAPGLDVRRPSSSSRVAPARPTRSRRWMPEPTTT